MSIMAGHESKSHRPVNDEGGRNLDCPHYSFCLDRAAYAQWPDFTCEYCTHRNTRQPIRLDDLDLETIGWEDIWCGEMSLMI